MARSSDKVWLAWHLTKPDNVIVGERLVRVGTTTDRVDALLIGLWQQAVPVRDLCANALDHLADSRCAEPLALLLDDPVPRVRRAALHSLGCDDGKQAPIPVTTDLVRKVIAITPYDPSVQVRRVVIETLGELRADPRA